MRYLKHERPHFFRTSLIWLSNLLIIAVIALFLTELFGMQHVVSGSAMRDTILDQDIVLIDKFTYLVSDPQRFDIILFEDETGTLSVKRIIGLPGETVQIVDGNILINGMVLENTPIGEILVSGRAQDEIVLDEDTYFVLGDNPSSSDDSRFENVKDVSRSSIIGKVWFCIYPLSSVGMIQ